VILTIGSDAFPQPVHPLEKDCLQIPFVDILQDALNCFEKLICNLKRENCQRSLDMAKQARAG
jgi:hypothetical protein